MRGTFRVSRLESVARGAMANLTADSWSPDRVRPSDVTVFFADPPALGDKFTITIEPVVPGAAVAIGYCHTHPGERWSAEHVASHAGDAHRCARLEVWLPADHPEAAEVADWLHR